MSEFDDGMACVHGVTSCDPCLERHSAQVRTLERQLAEAQARLEKAETDLARLGAITLHEVLEPDRVKTRARVLEEAAKVADFHLPGGSVIAAAIRALAESASPDGEK